MTKVTVCRSESCWHWTVSQTIWRWNGSVTVSHMSPVHCVEIKNWKNMSWRFIHQGKNLEMDLCKTVTNVCIYFLRVKEMNTVHDDFDRFRAPFCLLRFSAEIIFRLETTSASGRSVCNFCRSKLPRLSWHGSLYSPVSAVKTSDR